MKNNKNHSTPQANKQKEKSSKYPQIASSKTPSNYSCLNNSLRSDTLMATTTIMSVLISDFVAATLCVPNGTVITLSQIQQKIPIANEVVLQYYNLRLKKDNPIFEYASHQLEGMVIRKDNVINFRIHDADISLYVKKLVASSSYDRMNSTLAFNTSKESISEADLTSLMGNLSLFKDKNRIINDLSPSNNIIPQPTDDENTYGYFIRKNVTKIMFTSTAIDDRYIELNNTQRVYPRSGSANNGGLYGFDKVLNDLHNMIILPLKNSNIAKASGLMIPHGFLIYGHRGCGKTSIIEKLCGDSGIKSIWVDLKEIKREFEDPVSHVYDMFRDVQCSTEPTIIVLEDCEAYFPKDSKELMNDELEELCQVFLSNVKMIQRNAQSTTVDVPVSIIGTCSDISALSPNVYQNGIFDIEYEIPIPTSDERLKLLGGLLSQMEHHLDNGQFKYLANHTHGYLPRDLVLLTQFSSIQALIRYNNTDGNRPSSVGLTFEDFVISMREINPSVIKAFTTDIPKIRWDDIGGMDQVKNHLKECILWPILYADALSCMGIEPSSGVLLYGPPGCSKTMMARALAGESQMNFISIKGPELLNKYVGETEKTIRDLFKKARLATPCILFFDEMDAIAGQRDTSSSGHSDFNDRILAQFLTEIDGISGNNLNLFVVAATNRPFSIDSALMRPGRFDRLVYVPLPDPESRRSIFELQFKKIPTDDSIDIASLVERTNGYSGAEIVALCKEAAYCVLRESLDSRNISMTHFRKAMESVRPRVTSSSLQMYTNFRDQHYKI